MVAPQETLVESRFKRGDDALGRLLGLVFLVRLSRVAIILRPIRLKGIFSEGGEVIQLHVEGSITTPASGNKYLMV